MAEVARVLRPGGIFVGTTVMKAGAGIGKVLGDDVVRPLNNARSRSLLLAVTLHRSARPCPISLHIACFVRGGSALGCHVSWC